MIVLIQVFDGPDAVDFNEILIVADPAAAKAAVDRAFAELATGQLDDELEAYEGLEAVAVTDRILELIEEGGGKEVDEPWEQLTAPEQFEPERVLRLHI